MHLICNERVAGSTPVPGSISSELFFVLPIAQIFPATVFLAQIFDYF